MTHLRTLGKALFGGALLLWATGLAFGQNTFVVYVPNTGSANVSGYIIDESTGVTGGTLTPTTGSPYSLGTGAGTGNPVRTAVTPDHRFLYTANTNGTISLYRINPDGTLSSVTTQVLGITLATGIAIDSSFHLYVANRQVGVDTKIYGFNIDTNTGNLTALPGSPYSVSAGEQGAQSMVAVGSLLYVVEGTNNNIQLMNIQGNGSLTAGATFASQFTQTLPPSVPLDIKSDGAGHLYVTDFMGFQGGPGVAGFTIGVGGALTPLGVFNGGDNPQEISIATTSSGNYVYVANSNDATGGTASIGVYKINANGTLTAPTFVPVTGVGADPSGAAVDLSNNFLHVTDFTLNQVYAYRINQSTGGLTFVSSIATGVSPYFLFSTIAPPAPTAVPAASPWSLAFLGILLAGSMSLFYRKAYR